MRPKIILRATVVPLHI